MNKKQSKYFYTASLFDEALIELLNKKELEYISIREICEKAGVNRSTFYLHYESIYDLLNETLNYVDKKFTSKLPDNGITKDISNADKNDLIFINDEYLIPYLEFIKENKNVYLASYSNPKNMKSIERKIELDENIIKPILRRFNVLEDEMKYYCSFYINGISSIIIEWVRNNCNDSIDKMIKVIKGCVRPNYENYKKINNLINKYTKYTFASNLFIFIVKILLFILTKSFSFLIYSFYTLCIGLTKKNIFFNKKGKYTIVGILLLISSFLFINYSIFVMKSHHIINYSMYVGIAIAAVTFYDIGLAIYGIIKAKKNNDTQSKIYKLTNLATAIISLELTQTAILSFTNVGTDLSYYNGIGGIIFGVVSLIISIIIVLIGIKDN